MKLTKTDFILWRECPSNAWVKVNKKEEYKKFPLSEFEQSLMEMGNDVERQARGMFPNGYLIEKRSVGAQELTNKLIEERTPVIFQAVFETDKFITAADVLKWNEEAQAYDIYEIKMSSAEAEDEDSDEKPKVNKKKELQYEFDLAFQCNVSDLCGLHFNKKYLVRLNRKYVLHGELDFTPGKLFVVEDKTAEINGRQAEALHDMGMAYEYLLRAEPEKPCSCFYKRGRSSHCTTFSYLNPDVPKENSVHDLNRIGNSPKLLKQFVDENIFNIDQLSVDDERLLPSDPKSIPRKLNQVKVHKTKTPIIDLDLLKNELENLKFPLYFIDYETFPTAIPMFEGYHPYQHIVFQFSLHVLKERQSKLLHYEELITEGDPAEGIIKSLKEHIGPEGNLISWNKTFENSCNKKMAQLLPENSDFLNDLIRRTYDLEDIVKNQYVVYPGFKGRSSIKVVLPALISEKELSYKALGVKNGTDAIEAYRQIKDGELAGEAVVQKKKEMLEYCALDTLAMVRLWEFFEGLLKPELL